MADTPLALPAGPAVRRPRILLTGTAFAAGASLMAMVSLLAVYAGLRFQSGNVTTGWVPDGINLQLSPAGVAGGTLALSMVTVQWVVQAIGANDRRNAYVAAGVTLALGLAYINAMAFNFGVMGLGIASGTYAIAVYSVLIGHIVYAAVALLYLALMTVRTLGGQFGPRDREGVAAAALYWHVMVVTFAPVWYLVFVLK